MKNPEAPKVYESLGGWLEILDQKEKAWNAYRKALYFNPMSLDSRRGLTRIDKMQAPKFVLLAIAKNLSTLSHYQLLGIELMASKSDVQKAYRDCTKLYHPDRFFQREDQQLKTLAKDVYKRMVEAYVTLKSATKRETYDNELRTKSSPDSVAAGTSISAPNTAKGKQCWKQALAELKIGNREAAKLQLQLGSQAEPDCQAFASKLAEIG